MLWPSGPLGGDGDDGDGDGDGDGDEKQEVEDDDDDQKNTFVMILVLLFVELFRSFRSCWAFERYSYGVSHKLCAVFPYQVLSDSSIAFAAHSC